MNATVKDVVADRGFIDVENFGVVNSNVDASFQVNSEIRGTMLKKNITN
jgi:hypothetical protein